MMAQPELPHFSIIIATYNRKAVLERTLEALGRQNYPSENFSVVVVVDGSTDGTREMLESRTFPCAVRFFSQERKGPAAARNLGIQNAEGEIILFLDDDTIPNPNLLREHAKEHQPKENRVVRGRYLLHPESPPSSAAENHKIEDAVYWKKLAAGLEFPEDAICDANTSVPLALLRKVGGFDERFLYQRENVELGYRLYRSGGDYVYNPNALVYHYYLKSIGDLSGDAYWRGRNDALLIHKHPDYGGTRELNLCFNSHWSERWIYYLLWRFQDSVGGLLKSAFLLPFFPGRREARSTSRRIERFCAYCKGLQDAGESWDELSKILGGEQAKSKWRSGGIFSNLKK